MSAQNPKLTLHTTTNTVNEARNAAGFPSQTYHRLLSVCNIRFSTETSGNFIVTSQTHAARTSLNSHVPATQSVANVRYGTELACEQIHPLRTLLFQIPPPCTTSNSPSNMHSLLQHRKRQQSPYLTTINPKGHIPPAPARAPKP